MIASVFPCTENIHGHDRGIVRFEARRRHHRRNSLLYKRILVTANENHLFGHWIGAYRYVHTVSSFFNYAPESRMLGAKCDDVLHRPKHENTSELQSHSFISYAV